jgi:hypothetical protein
MPVPTVSRPYTGIYAGPAYFSRDIKPLRRTNYEAMVANVQRKLILFYSERLTESARKASTPKLWGLKTLIQLRQADT